MSAYFHGSVYMTLAYRPTMSRRLEAPAPLPAVDSAFLVVVAGRGGEVGRQYPVSDPSSIGRANDNDIVLDDPEISRRHATVARAGASHFIVDPGSTNGLFVNGKRIEESTLHDGDEVRLGTTPLRYAVVHDGA